VRKRTRSQPSLLASSPRLAFDHITLLFRQHPAQLAQRVFRIFLPPAETTLTPIPREELGERLQASPTLDQRADVDLTAQEVPHGAFVVVQRRGHEEVHERRPVASVVEDGFADLLPSGEGFNQALHGRVGGLGALEEAAVPADGVFAAVLGGIVEFYVAAMSARSFYDTLACVFGATHPRKRRRSDCPVEKDQ